MVEATEQLELPQGWTRVKLNQIGELIRGVSYVKEEASESIKEGYGPVLRANNIDRELNFDKLVFVPRARIAEEQLIAEFDIIIAMSSGSKDLVGKAAQARHSYDGGFGAFCGLVRIVPEVNRAFVGHFFQSPEYKDRITKLSSGVNINNLRREHIELLDIPLPPLPEQHRIVARIEEFLTKLDAGVEALRTARSQLRRYRQAVLKAAVTGELTKAWREAHQGELEPASELLARILRERREKWEADQLAKMKAAGKVPKNDEWKQKYKEPAPPHTGELVRLPDGWTWTHLDQLLSVLRNGISVKPDAEKGIPILRISALRPMTVDLNDHRFLPDNYEPITEYELKDGDLLFTRYNGNPSLVGVCGVVRNLQGLMVHPDKLIRGEVASELSSPTFLQIVLNVGESREFISQRARTTAGQTGISGGDLKSVPVPLAPYEEQKVIVEEVERLLSIADATERAIGQSLRQSERLRQSILKQAFAGKLVPQDPSDEPAEVLLARIREVRAKRDAAKPKRPKARPASRRPPAEGRKLFP